MLLDEALTGPVGISVFKVVAHSSTQPFSQWLVTTYDELTIPATQGFFIVSALLVTGPDEKSACFLDVTMPERIADYAYFVEHGRVRRCPVHQCNGDVIPAVGIEAYGNYELFYSKRDPRVGIAVLRNALSVARDKGPIAEDLGYILRDEGRPHEAIQAFSTAIAGGPSSDYIYSERGRLYEQIGDWENAKRDLLRGPPVGY